MEVLDWIVEKNKSYHRVILHVAINHHRTKVLRWFSVEEIKSMSRKRDLFINTCSAPNLDMFNFLLEIDYIAEQSPSLSIALVESIHVEMLRILVQKRGWTLNEEMFKAALERGCEDMLSCLLDLGCPHDDTQVLYQNTKEENIPWLIKNLPLQEDHLLDICINGPEKVLLCLVRKGCLPENFKDDPDITFAALEEGFISVAEEYLEQDYIFHDEVCLLVNHPTSLEWLIDKEIGLCSDLYHRLVRELNLPLLQKLEHLVDFPMDLLNYTFTLARECGTGRGNAKKVQKLKEIIEWIKTE